VLAAAASLEHGIEVSTVRFEDVSDNELAQYSKFMQGLTEGRKKQDLKLVTPSISHASPSTSARHIVTRPLRH
jgi:hypothetical protein